MLIYVARLHLAQQYCSGGGGAAAVAVTSLKVYLTTLLIKVFSFSDFLGGRDRDVDRTDGWTYGQTDFSRKIIF